MQVLSYWIMLRLLTWLQLCILKERTHREFCFSHIYIQNAFVIKLAVGSNFVCLSWVVWDLGGKIGIRWKWEISEQEVSQLFWIYNEHILGCVVRSQGVGPNVLKSLLLTLFFSFSCFELCKRQTFSELRSLPLSDWNAFVFSRFITFSWVCCSHFLQVKINIQT